MIAPRPDLASKECHFLLVVSRTDYHSFHGVHREGEAAPRYQRDRLVFGLSLPLSACSISVSKWEDRINPRSRSLSRFWAWCPCAGLVDHRPRLLLYRLSSPVPESNRKSVWLRCRKKGRPVCSTWNG